MRKSFLALLLASCNDPTIPGDKLHAHMAPGNIVDGAYYGALDPIENTCDRDYFPASGWTNLYDVILRPDGLYDLKPFFDPTTWPLSFAGVSLESGTLDHVEKWRSAYTGHVFDQSVVGTIAPALMDIVIRLDWEMTDNVTPCHQTARVHGPPWRVRDPIATDGRYRTLLSAYTPSGVICPGDAVSEHVLQTQMIDVVLDKPGTIKINFLGVALRGEMAVQSGADDQQLIATGDGYHLQVWEALSGFSPIWSSIRGGLQSGGMDLVLELRESQDDVCVHRYHVVGAKSVPGLDGFSGEYSLQDAHAEPCSQASDTRFDRLVAVDQGDGTFELFTSLTRSSLSLPFSGDGSFHDVLSDGQSTTTLDGLFADSHLTMDQVFGSSDSPSGCVIVDHISARQRFTQEPGVNAQTGSR
jgi:hypothetical protein